MSVCNRFCARRVSSGEITIFLGGTPLWRFRSRNLLTQRHQILSQKNYCRWGNLQWCLRDPRLRRFDTIQQCDRRTDRQTDAYVMAMTSLV